MYESFHCPKPLPLGESGVHVHFVLCLNYVVRMRPHFPEGLVVGVFWRMISPRFREAIGGIRPSLLSGDSFAVRNLALFVSYHHLEHKT